MSEPKLETSSQRKYPRAPQVRFDVLAEVIATAARKDSSHCMIAESLKAAIPGAEYIAVDLQSIRFSDLKKRLRYIYFTPRIAQEALIKFDQGEHNIEPFEVSLSNGQVSRMSADRQISVSQAAAKQAEKGKISLSPAEKAALSIPETKTFATSDTGRRGSPRIVGGNPPPIYPLASGNTGRRRKAAHALKSTTFTTARRRTFGLRALKR